MKRVILLMGISVALLAAGCGGTTAASLNSDDAAVVGSTPITKTQFQDLMDRAGRSYKAQKKTFPKPGSAEYEQLKAEAITYLVQQAEFAEEADKMGIKVSDSDIDKRIEKLKKQFYGGSEKRYEKALSQQGVTPHEARDVIRQQIISERVFKKVTGNVKISDAEIRAYYDSHKSQYGQPETREVRHILVQKKALADSLYAQLKGGGNFAQLAKKYSKDPGSASNGGKLTISKGQTVPAFDKTAFALKNGELSEPVHTQYGYHIIQALSSIKPAKTTPLSKVEQSIKLQLEQQRENEVMTKWFEDKKQHYCKSGIKYQIGYEPNPDPCASVTGATTTASQ